MEEALGWRHLWAIQHRALFPCCLPPPVMPQSHFHSPLSKAGEDTYRLECLYHKHPQLSGDETGGHKAATCLGIANVLAL